jgi:16S rRNA (uracil1498-N3)-methyltransferase
LVQAVTKGRSFETVLQKSCELGATEIQPLISERVIARPDEGEQAGKLARWAQVLTEATKQCGAAWLPAILPPRTLEESMSADVEVELRIGAFLHAGARHLRSIMDGFVGDHRRLPRSVSIWVGPEGDFADDEVSRLIGAGVCPLTLGSLVLRSETAAAAALAILGNELSAPRSGLSTGSGPGTIGQVDRGG